MEYDRVNESRRAINFFDPEVKITPEELKKIYDKAKCAPSSFNFQPYKILAVLSDEMKARLSPVANNQPKIKEASAVLVFVGNKRQPDESQDVFDDRISKGYMTADQVPGVIAMAHSLYEGRELGFVSRNVGLLAMNFMLAAQDLGWETHPMDGFDVDGVAELFGLEEKYVPVMMVAVGKLKPGVTVRPRGMRREFEKVFEIK